MKNGTSKMLGVDRWMSLAALLFHAKKGEEEEEGEEEEALLWLCKII